MSASPRVRVERDPAPGGEGAALDRPPGGALPRVPEALAAALAERQAALGAGPAAAAAARRLGEPGTLCVVTGQQPGLFGGPLLTFHKAAGTVRLARHLAERWRRPVVPVFWSASDDHDLDEVRCAWVLDREGQPRRVCVEASSCGESVRHVPLAAGAAARALEELAAALPDTPRGAEAVACVAAPGDPDLATWSLRCLLRLLGDAGLVVLEPATLAPHSGGILASLAERGAEVSEAVRASPGPLAPEAGDLPLFLRGEAGGPRRRARASDDVAAVARAVRRAPELASGDVVGRVLHQDALLPVAAFVVGPSEQAYVAQTRRAHDLLGVPFPPLVSRPSATWVDGRSARLARAFGLPVAAILAGAAQPSGEEGRLGEGLTALGMEVRALWERAAPLLARGGEGAASLRRGLERLEEEWSRAAAAAREGFARDQGVGRGRWARLQAALLPRGRPQERSLSPLSLVARHGVEALREGLAALDPLLPGHAVIHLAEEP